MPVPDLYFVLDIALFVRRYRGGEREFDWEVFKYEPLTWTLGERVKRGSHGTVTAGDYTIRLQDGKSAGDWRRQAGTEITVDPSRVPLVMVNNPPITTREFNREVGQVGALEPSTSCNAICLRAVLPNRSIATRYVLPRLPPAYTAV